MKNFLLVLMLLSWAVTASAADNFGSYWQGRKTATTTQTSDYLLVNQGGVIVKAPIGAVSGATAPIATVGSPGSMKPDGTTTTVDLDGTLHSIVTPSVPLATSSIPGRVKPDGTTTTVDLDGTLHSVSAPAATAFSTITGNPTDNTALAAALASSGGGGSGNVTGPSSSTIGHLAIYGNTIGTGIADGGAIGNIISHSTSEFDTAGAAASAGGTGVGSAYPLGTCTTTVAADGANGVYQTLSLASGSNCTITVPYAASVGLERRLLLTITQVASGTPGTIILATPRGNAINILGGGNQPTMNTAMSGRGFVSCHQTYTYVDCTYAQ